MADYQLFTVGSVDYTDKVKQTAYDVRKENVTQAWVDGNHRNRVSTIRTRIAGTVNLLLKKSEYNQFLADMETAKTGGSYYNLGVHPNNTTTGTGLVPIVATARITSQVAYGTEAYAYNPAGMYVTVEFEEM